MKPDENRLILELEIEIDLFEAYLATMEEFLEEKAREHRERLSDIRLSKQDSPDAGQSSPEEDFEQIGLEMTEQFANLLRRSFFVSLYSYFESRLVKECRSRRADNVLLGYSDIAGQNEIDKAKIYFTKVLRERFPSDTTEWQEIQNYRLLRNCIVHNRGRLDEMRDIQAQKPLQEYIKRKPTLSLRDEEVIIRRGFGEEAYRTVKDFLSLLLFSFRLAD